MGMLLIPVADPGIKFGRGAWPAREREPITGDWGGAPSGVQGQSPWWAVSPPEAESLSAFRHNCLFCKVNKPSMYN